MFILYSLITRIPTSQISWIGYVPTIPVFNTDVAERATLTLLSDDGSHRSNNTNVIYDSVDAGNCTVDVSAMIR